MQPSLGAKSGEGATAEAYAWALGQVVKLSKAGVPSRIGRDEAAITRAAFAAGKLALEVFDEVSLDGRFGNVLARLEGPCLIQAVRRGAWVEARGPFLLRMRALSWPPALGLSTRRRLRPRYSLCSRRWRGIAAGRQGELSAPVAAGLFALLARLPPAGGLCHRDPNPGNVILITDGPRLIDRIGARRAQAAFDLAADQVILTKGAPHLADDPERPRAIHTGLPPAYAALAGTSESRAGVVGGALISPLCGL